MRSPLMAPLWLTQPSAHRSLSSPSHLIFACAQRPGASGVRTHLLTGFAGRTDSLAPVLALDRAAAPGSSPTRCELGSSLFGPLQVLSSTAFDLPIILAISDTFSAALEVPRPLPRLLRRRASRRRPPLPPASWLDAQVDGGREAVVVVPLRPLLEAGPAPPAAPMSGALGRVHWASVRPIWPL